MQAESGPILLVEGPDALEARIARVTVRLAAHGLAAPPGSRLARFPVLHRRFVAKELSPAGRGSLADVNELLEGNRDFAELATIVEHLLPPQPPADPVLLPKLRLILGGAAFPSGDANPLARNTQFELYAAALFQGAGIPTLLREPDGIITAGEVRLAVAAKRPGSSSHIRRLVRDAAKQVRKVGIPGIVALSLDRLFAPNDERIVGRSAEDLKPAARELLHATVRPLLPDIDAAVAGTPVLLVLASLVIVAAVPTQNSIGRLGGVFLHGVKRPTDAQHAALLHLARALGKPPDV